MSCYKQQSRRIPQLSTDLYQKPNRASSFDNNSLKMDLLLVLLPMIVAASLASIERCASSPASRMDLLLHSQKNSSGHWIITVTTQRPILTENQRELIVNVHQEKRLCGNNEIEQLISMTTVYLPVQDSSMSGPLDPTAPSTTTMITSPMPVSCPHSGYQLFPEFNCYKAFPSGGERKTWSDSREQCRRDGGHLMVMETERERKDVFIPLYNSVSWCNLPWVGVYIPQGGDGWMTVKDEPALSTWWEPGEPCNNAAHKCAGAVPSGLLVNMDCAYRRPFICEIPL